MNFKYLIIKNYNYVFSYRVICKTPMNILIFTSLKTIFNVYKL